MELQPLIVGENVIVRPMVESDFDSLFLVASDRLIWDMHPFPRYEKAAFVEFFEPAVKSQSGFVFVDRKTQKIFGTSRYYNFENDHVFIGYTFLARSHWGGRYNREIKSLMLGHAFKYVNKVYFDIGETNYRSRKAIEKIGAKFVKNQELKGKPYTLYVIDRESSQLR